MNLLLVSADSVQAGGKVTLSGRQAQHCLKVLKSKCGDSIRVGIFNGPQGTASVEQIDGSILSLQLNFNQQVPLSSLDCPSTSSSSSHVLPVEVLVGLPRPKVLDKMLQHLVSLGVCRIILVCTQQVERSYLSSPKLTRESIINNLQLGLEQSTNTRFPAVSLFASWKGWLGSADSFIRPKMKLIIAHPTEEEDADPKRITELGLQSHSGDNVLAAIGPEGGWLDDEVADMRALGFEPFTLGPNILTCDTAATTIVAQLQLLLTDSLLRPPPPLHRLWPRLPPQHEGAPADVDLPRRYVTPRRVGELEGSSD
eukprot:GHVS01042995.1.p1 GENE.GHVS01042995.1~~GHVS01042995.1.p1  ORF type:complete len:312 (+),score=59.00 GHVS01042995.1:95-1030(+)